MTRMLDRIAAGELALGVWIKGGPQLIPSLAKAGFDYVHPDMMFSSLDWKELDHILRASEAADLTCWLRVASNPWAAGSQQLQVTVDTARAFSLGVPAVNVSVASALQVKALLEVTKDWHRSGAGEYPSTSEEFQEQSRRSAQGALLIPSIESKTAIDEIDDILVLDGLRAVMIACTDFSKQLGRPFEYDHPEVWSAMDRIIEAAQKRGIVVAANTGYLYNTPDRIIERVAKLYDHGVRIVMIQGIEFLIEMFSRSLIADVRRAVG